MSLLIVLNGIKYPVLIINYSECFVNFIRQIESSNSVQQTAIKTKKSKEDKLTIHLDISRLVRRLR